MATGRVTLTLPSTRRKSGLVKTSSVGRFGTYSTPAGVFSDPPSQMAPGRMPTVRSVPSPRKWIDSKFRSWMTSSRACVRAMCSRQAATGSGASRRIAMETASHSRSTSGSPKTVRAQLSVGTTAAVQATRPLPMAFPDGAAHIGPARGKELGVEAVEERPVGDVVERRSTPLRARRSRSYCATSHR